MQIKKLNGYEVGELSDGTYNIGKLIDVNYTDIVAAFGEPSFPYESGDGKVQVEWVFKFDGKIYTLYDWKTYDRTYTMSELTEWMIGGKSSVYDFLDALESEIKQYQL